MRELPPDALADLAPPPERLTPLCAADVIIRPVKWLWRDVLVQGALNSIQGIAGIGKTFKLCAVAAAVSSGGCVQSVGGGMEPLQCGRVLYLSGDDDPSTTLVPRMTELGADLGNIHFAPDGMLPQIGSGELKQLFEAVKPSLCVIDTLQHFLPGRVDLNSANSTTSALQPLKVLAEKYNCAVVVIQHISKIGASGNGGFSVNFGIGSAAVNGLFRSVWTLGRLKDSDGRPSSIRAIAPSKTNLVKGDAPCILFELSQDRGFLWAGVDHDLTAEELYSPTKTQQPREAPERDECAAHLKALLADGPVLASAVWDATKANGFSEKTVKRTKKEMGIESKKEGDVWVWNLQGGQHTRQDDLDPLDLLDQGGQLVTIGNSEGGQEGQLKPVGSICDPLGLTTFAEGQVVRL
ncbi:MAG: AAA family ATPase [Oscillospiraceae bacterium]|nr:AAA family ATPase [Oscillospiraceae bacterium]